MYNNTNNKLNANRTKHKKPNFNQMKKYRIQLIFRAIRAIRAIHILT